MATYSTASSYTSGTSTPASTCESDFTTSESCSEYEYPSETSDTEIIDIDSDSDTDTTITNDDTESYVSRATSVDSSIVLLADVRGTTPALSVHDGNDNKVLKVKAETKARRAGPRRRLTDTEQAQIVMLREKNWTFRAIGELLDCSKYTIKSFCDRRNKKINQLIATLPGSSDSSSAPGGGRSGANRGRRAGVKNEVKYERDVGIGGSRFVKKDEYA